MGFLDDLNSLAGGFSSTYFPMMRWNREQNRADEVFSIQKALKDLETQKLQMELDDRNQANDWFGKLSGFMTSGGQGGQQPQGSPPIAPQSSPGASAQPSPYKGATVKDLPLSTMNLLDYWGRYHGIPEDKLPFLYGIAANESGGNQWAKADEKNGTSSHGFMQINDVNLNRLQPGENVYDPSVSARIGTQIFKQALDSSGGDPNAALGAYASGRPNASLPYVGRVLQAMGTAPDNPGTFQVAAAPTGTMSDASGPPPGIGGQQPGQGQPQAPAMPGGQITGTQDPRFLNLLIAGSAHPNKRISEASKNLLSGMRNGIDVLNSRNPEYLSSLKVLEAVQIEAEKRALESAYPKMSENLNIINNLAPKVQDGSATREEVLRYTLAYNEQYGKVQAMPDGSMVRLNPPQGVPTPPGWQGDVSGQKPMAASDAGKLVGARLGTQYLDKAMSELFDSNGELNRDKLARSYVVNQPEQSIRNSIREAIGYALYLKTGAAATPREVDEQEKMYMPTVTDNSAVARDKLMRLRSLLSGVWTETQERGKPSGKSAISPTPQIPEPTAPVESSPAEGKKKRPPLSSFDGSGGDY